MRNKRDREKAFSRRSFISLIAKTALFGVLTTRFGFLQIFNSKKYSLLAENNSIKLIVMPPFRSKILDCDGNALAQDEEFYGIAIKSDSDTYELKNILNKIYEDEIKLSKYFNVFLEDGKLNNNSYYLLLKPLTIEEIATIEVKLDREDIKIVKIRSRKYQYPISTAHITGYISKINDALITGKSGIELYFNDDLTGEAGLNKYEVNAKGQIVRELEKNQPSYGKDISLSIDVRLQEIIHSNLKDRTSACIVLDAENAKVVGLYSSPSFDQNIFTGGVDKEHWEYLNSGHAILNRAISSNYPPASIFKIVIALAILDKGINPNRKIFCSGQYVIGNRTVRCWKKCGHGFVDLKSAIAASCNVYFYIHSLDVGIDNIAFFAKELGFGAKTSIELQGEVDGLVPTKSWKFNKFKERWMVGDTINVSIGQGFLLATPIQIITALTRVFTSQKVYPSILKDSYTRSEKLKIKKEHIEIVKEGLRRTFSDRDGACRNHREEFGPLKVIGKTGTAQTASLSQNKKDNSIFAGVCTHKSRSYSIITLIEGGGWGSGAALPISAKIINSYIFS